MKGRVMHNKTGLWMIRTCILFLAFVYLAWPGCGYAQEAADAMIRVEGGSFLMGKELNLRPGGDETKPVHQVAVRSFQIGKYEVTFDEYDAYCQYVGRKKPSDNSWGRGQRPVINVTWYDAVDYCNWRSRQEGLTPAYQGIGKDTVCDFSVNGYRLPTEAEWEYAARGGLKSGGFYYSGSNNPDDVAWWNGEIRSRPVGQKKANELGLYDMSGNVWEWCWDRYGRYPDTAAVNPAGPSAGNYRVMRGGCWDGSRVLVFWRFPGIPSDDEYNLGFRLARTAQ